ncbi:hypothetical protein GGF42_001302 [Coemansia sp. RSA 2424]|nr:hypothetical protein GGF42_001302 [Coemansia sp. RSA 2424]
MGNVCFDTNQCVFYELESGYSSGQSDSEDSYSFASEAPSLSAVFNEQNSVQRRLKQGTAFAKVTRNTLVMRARKILKEVGGTERGRDVLVRALERVSPELWPIVAVDPARAAYEQVEEGLTHFEQILRASTLAKLNLGESKERTAKEDGDDSQRKPSRSARHHARTRAMLKGYKQFKAERG